MRYPRGRFGSAPVMLRTLGLLLALRLGVGTAVGMAATWHLAAATPNLEVQEYQHKLAEAANQILLTPLSTAAGELVVPAENGLGIQVAWCEPPG